ncbi:MAG: DinB family protein [Planctomycetes bacterium]|nr:DinB family protein [Planctomycetota bacterium]
MAKKQPGPVVIDRYRDALGERDPIRTMASSPDRIAKLLRGLDEATLSKRPAPGKWSIKEVVAHLADWEFVLGTRVRLVAALDRPALHGYDQDAFVENLAVDRATTGELLVSFAAVRAANVALFERLPKSAHARVGIHTERGEESIAKMLVIYAGHDLIHEAQLARMAAESAPKKASQLASKKAPKKAAKRPKPR